MSKRGWFVSGWTQIVRVNTRREAVALAGANDLIIRECACGCGKPAAKAVQR